MFLKRRQPKSLPSGPVAYPEGTVVKTPSGTFYLKKGKRYKVISDRVLNSWSFPRVVETSDAAISKYPAGINSRLGFRDGSLIYNLADARLFLVEGNLLRHVTNPDVLPRIGANYDEVIIVSQDELKLHREGEELK